MNKSNLFIISITLMLTIIVFPPSRTNAQSELLIRCDDMGMSHTVNMAVNKLIETGIPFSVSVMFACPWYQEAVEILRDNPQVSAGVHLTLNSEWKNYKWGPVAGRTSVPSLVDSNGFFYESDVDFINCGYKLDEVETELRAQIVRAINSGVKIDYVDAHMNMAFSTPELCSIVEKLAAEFNLGISHYFSEEYQTLWETAPEKKSSRLLEIINGINDKTLNLLVIHLGMETEEMLALVDLNYPADPYRVAQHRQAELNALSSRIFETVVQKKNVKLITYKELISRIGLKVMKQPDFSEF
ncbi:MAG: ChbG/HpnK family deacetylase [Ignavibacteriaceae bacterium]